MRARRLVATFATLFLIISGARIASADPRGDVEKKIKEAMESYDGMDYDAARKLLNQALAAAKKAKLDKDSLAAKAYLDLGIVSFANSDPDAAKLSFLSAVQIDPKIQIDAAYKSPEMAKLLDQARSEAGGSGSGGGEAAAGDVNCTGVKGLQHTIIDSAKGGTPQPIEVLVGSDVTAVKVSAMYRGEGATEFTEVRLTKQGDCKYTGQIPGAAMHGGLVHYYVAAFNDNNKPVAAKGSAGSPNIIEVTGGGAPTKGDEEDPIGKAKAGGGGGGGGGEVSTGVTLGPKHPKVMVAFTGGTGVGFLGANQSTEGMNTVHNPGLGNSLVVLQPEIGYYINRQVTIGAAFRVGLPLGANVTGHATGALAGLLRVRYGLSSSGDGVYLLGQVGAGVLRNTIKLDNSMPGMDTDVVGTGPLLVGAGLGFRKQMSDSFAFLAELSALAGIATSSQLGGIPINSGIAADLGIGLAYGF